MTDATSINESPISITGDELALDDYLADFRDRFWNRSNTGAWKFERRQVFRQPESASWKAFDDGDWDRSLRLLEERRPKLVDYFDRVEAHGFSVRRVRVVEEPLSPYLIWELNSLLIRHESGASISVVDAAALAEWERDGPLPEIFVLGPDTVYEVRYDADGVAVGAVRCVDRPTAQRWTTFIESLHRNGERIDAFFGRVVRGLRPAGRRAPSA
ncbi:MULTISPECIES: DUF6879 family protein [unclassified Saccharopolyspora]|uniref:DUF6879 family protein n=1 Tax=unclassified Saccharopolyspora TaxID=2646250 RepID=UPI001CD265E2|nr:MULTISPECIES: DUF6879 family protein [unclassified Saccharopolyspora]MCA1187387.1 hypothetical protein [Saccharopolyspora sp. 6T]MCA1224761.1 hypothetical protein [Saccharopolyspora sp. 6M]MCA1280894.1 hypothetical protein [Saccharopolyspora sp. 7B]